MEPTMSEAAAAATEPSFLSGRTLNIEDLNDVISLLERHHYNKATYDDLALRLKTSPNTLERIRKDNKDVNPCFTECLASWLRKTDGKENPTIDALIAALREIGQNAVADGITRERESLNGLSKGLKRSATDQKGDYDGITGERESLNGLSKGLERSAATDQKGDYDESSLSGAAKPTAEPTDQNGQSTPSSADATPTGAKNNPPKQSNKKRGFGLFSRKKNQHTPLSSDTNVAARDILLEDNFRRSKKGFWLFKDTFEQEKVCIQRQGDSICLVTGKKDKEILDMKTCTGVYSRMNFDHASKKWPGDAEPECCFTVVDEEDHNTLYLVANNPDIAEKWVKELKRHVHLKKGDRRKGYFGFYDLQDVYDTLTEDESTTWNIDLLATSLGLSEDTQKTIKEYRSTEKDRLRECLYHWLKGADGDGDTEAEGPKCDELKEALKSIGKEEIAEKIDKKFLQTGDIAESVQHANNEGYRKLAWEKRKKGDHYEKAVAAVKKASPAANLVLHYITQKMEQNDIASVLAEISFLSNKKMSSLVTIKNETRYKIEYLKCYIARGREANYVGFDRSVSSNDQISYSFESLTHLSLEGCAAMLFFSATTCKSEELCFFVVAFRNYVIKVRRRNKTVVMILDSSDSIEKLNNLQQYAKIMNIKDSSKIPGMIIDINYEKPFMMVGRGDINALKFPFIKFALYMSNDNYQSQSIITVSHP